MRVIGRPFGGVVFLEAAPKQDERGSFIRLFCAEDLAAFGVDGGVAQANLSHSTRRATLRGLHYQIGPSAETKVVTCLAGALHDVVLDLREASPTFGRWAAIELSALNRRIAVIPEGCAHGFITLTDACTALYFVSAAHDPVRERGVRWDDPAFGIAWPLQPAVISERDQCHPDFDPGYHRAA